MAAVDATEVVTKNIWAHGWNADEYDGACATSRHCAHLAHIALAALFARAGIDGPGTIALTRDDEGRYRLGVADVLPRAAINERGSIVQYLMYTPEVLAADESPVYRLVPVEDDGEESETCDSVGHDFGTVHMDADGRTTWRCRRCGAEGRDYEQDGTDG